MSMTFVFPSVVVDSPAAPGSTPVSKIATITPRPSYSGCFSRKSSAPISAFGRIPRFGKLLSERGEASFAAGVAVATIRAGTSAVVSGTLAAFSAESTALAGGRGSAFGAEPPALDGETATAQIAKRARHRFRIR